TARHRLRSGTGWSRVGELRVGDRIAAAHSVPEPQDPVVWPDGHVVLLGHLIARAGDGSYLEHQPLRYTTSSEENSAAVADAARWRQTSRRFCCASASPHERTGCPRERARATPSPCPAAISSAASWSTLQASDPGGCRRSDSRVSSPERAQIPTSTRCRASGSVW